MANAEAVEGTKRDCKIEEMLSSRIGPMLAKLYKIDRAPSMWVQTRPATKY